MRGLDRLTRLSKKHDAWDRRFYTLLVFGTGFTPDELNTADPVLDDRPYASLLGVSVRRLAVNDASFDEAWSSELVVAMLGLHQARNLQTWIHRELRERSGEETPYDPLGWHNQISDGGEPTALYRVGYERRLLGDPSGPDNRKHFQLTGGFDCDPHARDREKDEADLGVTGKGRPGMCEWCVFTPSLHLDTG